MSGEKPDRQGQKLAEYLDSQVTDNAPADPAQGRFGGETGDAAQHEYGHECERNPSRGLQILCNQRIVHQRLQQENQPGLNDGRRRHPNNGNATDQFVRRYVVPQATVDDSNFEVDALFHVSNIS